MYNLCRSDFRVSVQCIPSVHSDGHEPCNLISCDAGRRRRGFRSERFIKPPVQVAFTTSYPFCVQSVLVSSAQQSCTIEVWVFKRIGHNCDGNREEAAIQPTSIRIEKDCKWFCSARSDIVAGVVTQFQNARFRDDSIEAPVFGSFLSKLDPVCQKVELKNGYHWLSTQGIAVRIVKVEGGAVPGLQSIEIWGVLASDCVGVVRKNMLAVCERVRNERHSSGKDESFSSRKRKRESMVTNRTDDNKADGGQDSATAQTICNIEFPDEFLDEITFEVMLQPILLPSGHNVDATTVEKHKRVEATWGRPSSDPFTGLPYSSTSKPLPNVSLKARIDQFLNDYHYSINAKGGKRLGVSKEVEINSFDPKESVLVTQRQEVEQMCSLSTQKDLSNCTGLLSTEKDLSNCTGLKAVEYEVLSCSSHSARLRSSLDFELQQVLGVRNQVDSRTQGHHVASCVGCLSDERQLLKMSCNHLICRQCSLKALTNSSSSTKRNTSSEMECPVCKLKCLRSEVVIVHSQCH